MNPKSYLAALRLLVLVLATAAVLTLDAADCVNPPTNLISWWRAEANADDWLGANNGTMSGGVTFTNGEVGQAFSYNGIDGRVIVSNSPSLNFGSNQDFSIEAWISPLPSTTDFGIMSVVDKRLAPTLTESLGYEFNLDGGRVHCRLSDSIQGNGGAFGPAGPDLRDGLLHHIALTLARGATNGGNLYVDGQSVLTFDPTGVRGDLSNTEPLRIGNHASAFVNAFFKGLIDEVSIYGRALSSAEILAVYNAGSGGKCLVPCAPQPPNLVSWWRAELDGSDAVGSHNGTPHAGVTFTNGEVGHAFNFDGTTNAYLEVPDAPELRLTNELTIEFWVKRQRLTFPGYPYSDYIIEKGGDWTGNQDNYSAALHNPQYNYCLTFIYAGGWRGGGSIADTNTWHHCAITARNGDVNPTLYIDGVAQPVVVGEGGNINLYPSTRPLHIGAQLDPGTGWFYYSQVLVDELSLYNRILSAAEIQAIYNAGSAGKCTPPATPPTITSQPANYTASAGDNAFFNVSANGTSPLYYQWYFQNSPLTNGTSQSLILTSVTPSQAGTYYVVVTNAYGTATSSNATLTVLTFPPTITRQPPNTNVFVGANVGLTVLATGSPTLTYQWQKDGSLLPGATSFTYRILNAQVTNSGTYSVVVSNPYGSATSSNAVLTVRVPPPCVSPAPGLVSWWRAETNQLDNWDSNDGAGPALGTAQLYGPGKVGQAFVNPRVIVLDSASLRMTNALTLQAWINPTTLSGTIPYTIISKFDSPSLPGTGNQSSFWFGTTNNGLLEFIVSGTGSQRTNTVLIGPLLPLNQWSFVVATFDGIALRLYVNGVLAAQRGYAGSIFPGNQNLGIGAVPLGNTSTSTGYPFSGSIDEACIYNRALTDSEIQDIYNADVSGMCLQPPVIVAQPQSQAIPLGEDLRFSVGVHGNRPLRYQWFFNSNRLLGATNSSLLLERIHTNQAGAYSVSVTNSIGFALSATANLTLLPAPTCTHAPDGIISWWPANSSPVDVVGTNNATLFAPATYVPGKVGAAFTTYITDPIFQNAQIQVANSPSLNFGSNVDFSIEAWIKTLPFVPSRPGLLPNQGMVIVQKRTSNPFFPAGPGYALTLNEGRLSFWLSTSSTLTNPPVISSGPDLRDSMFHHVAVTLQRGATNGGRLYVDGQLVHTFNPTSQRGSLVNTFPLYIGSAVQQVDGPFTGYIDELTIYNRALSADEIMAIRTAGAAGKCDHPPLLTSFLTKGLQDEPLFIPASRFLLFSSDPDGDALSLFSVTSPSQNGRPVVLGTNQVTYTPAPGYLGQDSFTYTLSDGHGSRVSATALVLIEPRMAASATLLPPAPPGPGGLQLGFTGYPERTYTVQRAESLEGPWTDLGTALTDADGVANFTDPNPPPVGAYYRAVYHGSAIPSVVDGGEVQPEQ